LFGPWDPLLLLLVLVTCLLFVRRVLNQHLPGVIYLITRSEQGAFLFFYLLLLPGVFLHEISHWMTAKLLGVQVGGVSLRPQFSRDGKRIELGAVRIARSDPFRESIVGVAPLVTGSALVLYLARNRLGLQVFSAQVVADLPTQIRQCLSAPDAWIWLYLIFAISNAMLPSQSDRRPWGSLLLYGVAVAALFYFVGGVRQVPDSVVGMGLTTVRYLSWAFALTIAVDVAVIALLLIIEALVWLVLGRRMAWFG
jgi:hypothetical protein